MNTYITDALKRAKQMLALMEKPTAEALDPIIGELEMIKMEIEQHVANMPQDEACKYMRYAAQSAVLNLSEITELLEELPFVKKKEYRMHLCEILNLIDEIDY